jgi:hypothetical protein
MDVSHAAVDGGNPGDHGLVVEVRKSLLIILAK